ncbi:MAG: hypothetical protein US11_C0004G0052 [Candidatus Roizmanbacteria bacterium GW2011_GWA2_36_23]|uniref:Methyltransferase small domain-containing protein n=1 Tax=Candidatus Roizmanbacteria bacterium GW2011_GWA2_36_23 TaxID=1618480 RepID=A0A0G0E8C4_9BACT|nr:MAG: hypothetical protein US11_C0004G0052 [Candidatus Roizmanbacteria bacterium GW2011_GWA2_36_23]
MYNIGYYCIASFGFMSKSIEVSALSREKRQTYFRNSHHISVMNIRTMTGSFPFYYAEDLVLTPDYATVASAQMAIRYLTDQGIEEAKVADIGTGSGIFASSLILADNQHLVSQILASDIYNAALISAEYNIQAAKAMMGMIEKPAVELLERDWLEDVYGKFDIIHFDPPYLTSHTPVTKLKPEFHLNPLHTMYVPYPTYHYAAIFESLPKNVKKGTLVILRIPTRDQVKKKAILGSIYASLNSVEIRELLYLDSHFVTADDNNRHIIPEARYLTLCFN